MCPQTSAFAVTSTLLVPAAGPTRPARGLQIHRRLVCLTPLCEPLTRLLARERAGPDLLANAESLVACGLTVPEEGLSLRRLQRRVSLPGNRAPLDLGFAHQPTAPSTHAGAHPASHASTHPAAHASTGPHSCPPTGAETCSRARPGGTILPEDRFAQLQDALTDFELLLASQRRNGTSRTAGRLSRQRRLGGCNKSRDGQESNHDTHADLQGQSWSFQVLRGRE